MQDQETYLDDWMESYQDSQVQDDQWEFMSETPSDYQSQIDALVERVELIEEKLQFWTDLLTIDPELSMYLLGFWLTSFVLAHVAGRVARTMGKF